MSRKDYMEIAKIISLSRSGIPNFSYYDPSIAERDSITAHIAYELILYFKDDNPRFDSERFLEACGLAENSN